MQISIIGTGYVSRGHALPNSASASSAWILTIGEFADEKMVPSVPKPARASANEREQWNVRVWRRIPIDRSGVPGFRGSVEASE
jgi:hypothetical protein